MAYNGDMALEYDISDIKVRYRTLFAEAVDTLYGRLATLRTQHTCPTCDAKNMEPELLSPMHTGCGYRAWQQACLHEIEQGIAQDILTRLNNVQAYKKTFDCHQCGVCCRIASSEFSFEQLQHKAQNGDSFAKQFTSIFLPYPSRDAVRERFPEIVDSVLKQADEPEQVFFYHCPYVGEDNSCTIYGQPKRPKICANYPDTPLTFIYNKCAWKPWKDETHDDALWAHAMIELCSSTAGSLKAALTA